MKTNTSFLGTGWGFPPTFLKSEKGVQMISDAEDIRSSLEILLSTSIGERELLPQYGCDLSKLLFEPLSTSLKSYVSDLINDAILYHEPRIRPEKINLTIDPLQGAILIEVNYTILATNTRHNHVYPFYLTEGTNNNR
jgi:phage baseplate assembly protein W